MHAGTTWRSAWAVAAAIAIALAAPGIVRANHVGCGAVVRADVTLDSDLLGCPGNGIVIAAGGVTVDLAGHAVEGMRLGTRAGFGVATTSGTSHVTVLNGKVGHFHNAVVLGSGTDYRVRNVTVYASHDGVLLPSVDGATVERVTATGNDGSGITAPVSRHVTIRGNYVHDNLAGVGGVGLDSSALVRNRIEHNTFYGMRYGGVTGTTFARNVLSGNGEFGIGLESGSTGNLLIRNVISRTAGRGISMSEDSSANALYRNRSDRNTGDGFSVEGAGAALMRNEAARNGALGFDVPLGAALARHNRAGHNGDTRQCVGIPCR